MRLYKEKTNVPVNELLRSNKEYQRNENTTRWKKIRKSIEKDGWWPHSVIVCNRDGQPVDGQHRIIAAGEIGLETIPVVKYEYDSIEEEAKHFSQLNNWTTSLANVDEWKARLVWNCPIATLIYNLNRTSESPLYQMIKTHDNKQGNFSITTCIQIINTVLFGLRADHHSKGQKDTTMTRKVEEAVSTLGMDEIYKRIALFTVWFKPIAEANNKIYNQQAISAILIIWHSLRAGRFFNNQSIVKKTQTWLKKFDFTKEFVKSGYSAMVSSLSGYLKMKIKPLEQWNPYVAKKLKSEL